MLIDHRTYRCKVGTVNAQLELYEKYGLAVQVRHLGKPVAYMTSESGELNLIIHLWAFEDAADRAKKRAAMMADPDWAIYLQKNAEAGNIIEQKTNLMLTAKFAPIAR